MEKEKQIDNSGDVGGVWDSLADIPFKTGGGFKTRGGIILTGEAAREQMMKQFTPKTEEKAEVSQAETVEAPVEAEAQTAKEEAPQKSAGPTGVAEIDAILTGGEVEPGEASESGAAEAVDPVSQEDVPEDEEAEVVEFTAQEAIPNGEAENEKAEEVAFVQSTELGDKLQRDPKYFTYLVNAEHGFAVEKSKAVDTYIEKMEQAENDKEVWQAMRMGRDILNGKGDFSDEEKQRVRDFMNSPLGRKKELEYRISSAQKSLGGIEEGIKRSEEEYNQLNSKNIVDKFLNRWKVRESRNRLEAIRRRRDGVLRDIRRQQAELQAIEDEQSELERAA